MAWLYLPDTAALNSESTPPSEAVAPFVTLSGKATPRPLSWRGWQRRPYIRLLSGTTLPPSTADLGVASWISSLRDSRASHSAQQESAKAKPTSGGSGMTSSGCLGRFAPDGSWEKTSPDLFHSDSDPSSEAWPSSGTMQNGVCFGRQTLVRHIGGSGFSSLPIWPQTPMASDAEGGVMEIRAEAKAKLKLRDYGAAWPNWPTMTASEADKNAKARHEKDRVLTDEAKNWPTPRAHAADSTRRMGTGGKILGEEAKNWPTPQAHDSQVGKTPEQIAKMRAKGHGVANLNEMAPNWPTPMAGDWKDTGDLSNITMPHGKIAYIATYSPPALKISTCGPECLPKHRKLNPAFVEWLMGLPPNWTIAKIGSGPAATELCHYKQQLRSALLRIVPDGT